MTLLPLILAVTLAHTATIKVAIVDTGVDPADTRIQRHVCPGHTPWDFVTNATMRSTHISTHGTHVTGLIIKNAGDSDYCLLLYRWYNEFKAEDSGSALATKAFYAAAKEGADIINFSGGGAEPYGVEKMAISSLLNVLFVVAAGNERSDLETKPFYPASYNLPNIVVVGGLDKDGRPTKLSNYGKKVTAWEMGEHVLSYYPGGGEHYMLGTSMATAIRTGKIVKRRSDASN